MISLQPLGDPDALSCEGGVCALPDADPGKSAAIVLASDRPRTSAGIASQDLPDGDSDVELTTDMDDPGSG